MKSDCRRCREALRLGPETPADLASHREHLAGCAECRRERLRQQALAAALAPSPAPPPPEGMAERLMLRLEAEGCLSPVGPAPITTTSYVS